MLGTFPWSVLTSEAACFAFPRPGCPRSAPHLVVLVDNECNLWAILMCRSRASLSGATPSVSGPLQVENLAILDQKTYWHDGVHTPIRFARRATWPLRVSPGSCSTRCNFARHGNLDRTVSPTIRAKVSSLIYFAWTASDCRHLVARQALYQLVVVLPHRLPSVSITIAVHHFFVFSFNKPFPR